MYIRQVDYTKKLLLPNRLFSQQTLWLVIVGKAQLLLINNDIVTVYQDPETEAAKWSSTIIHFIS